MKQDRFTGKLFGWPWLLMLLLHLKTLTLTTSWLPSFWLYLLLVTISVTNSEVAGTWRQMPHLFYSWIDPTGFSQEVSKDPNVITLSILSLGVRNAAQCQLSVYFIHFCVLHCLSVISEASSYLIICWGTFSPPCSRAFTPLHEWLYLKLLQVDKNTDVASYLD